MKRTDSRWLRERLLSLPTLFLGAIIFELSNACRRYHSSQVLPRRRGFRTTRNFSSFLYAAKTNPNTRRRPRTHPVNMNVARPPLVVSIFSLVVDVVRTTGNRWVRPLRAHHHHRLWNASHSMYFRASSMVIRAYY